MALSSAESELCTLVKCVSELLGIRSAVKDWGINVGGVVKTDASAACWASYRGTVWAKSDTLTLLYCTWTTLLLKRLWTSSKYQALQTLPTGARRGLTKDKIHKFLSEANMRFFDGRADAAAKLQGS